MEAKDTTELLDFLANQSASIVYSADHVKKYIKDPTQQLLFDIIKQLDVNNKLLEVVARTALATNNGGDETITTTLSDISETLGELKAVHSRLDKIESYLNI